MTAESVERKKALNELQGVSVKRHPLAEKASDTDALQTDRRSARGATLILVPKFQFGNKREVFCSGGL